MDRAFENHASFIGRPASELPTPSLIVDLPVLKKNVNTLHENVEKLGIGFRPHVKTLKTLEITRLMLAGGKYRSIIASTICEIRGCIPLVKEGLLDEVSPPRIPAASYQILYGLPIYPGALQDLVKLRESVRIQLLVDNEEHIDVLEKSGTQPWDVFIKLDVGSRRAGIPANSTALQKLVERADRSSAVKIAGFYCHAGHSYAGRSLDEAQATLETEISSVLNAAALLPPDRALTVSIGATPTAHVVQYLKTNIPSNVKFELHAGNFPCNDLQQVSTGLVAETDQAIRVAAEVCGVYPERNEALVNAGVVALSREGSGYSGFGRVIGKPAWEVVRLSQEHGIIGTNGDERATENFKIGQRVNLYCNHSCITAAAFYVYFGVDENDIVREAWIPWKGW
ncbi:unnamed protein product [Clonostachys rosea]|uniref:D-serine dehydratase-like domain-containing protein n=1 Tax=Bionectria ochroleuca TaxID=29856 RepID=A0ABY6U2F2_BIOOC|nr:unnamed protein product [Clonostachys rosea]